MSEPTILDQEPQPPSAARIDFRYLSEPEMIEAGVTDMASCVDTMEEVFRLLHSGDYRMAGSSNDSHGAMVTFPNESPFEHMPKNTSDRRFMAMPAYLGGDFRTTAVKWYGSNVENRGRGLPRSVHMLVLNDTDTGAPLAVMSANLLSAYRTGAVPGVGARHLARKDSRVVGIVGPGVMARTSLEAFVAVHPEIDTVKVKGRGEGSVQAFTEWVHTTFPQIAVTAVDTVEAVVRHSDIVTYCTTAETGDRSTYPLVKREWLAPGTFLSMPAACQIDDATIESDVRMVVDNRGLYEAWAEETPSPTHTHVPIVGCRFLDLVDEGRLDSEAIEDLGDIVSGERPGRTTDDEIIMMSVGGMPVEDVAWATVLYRRAVEREIGTPLNLWDTPALS